MLVTKSVRVLKKTTEPVYLYNEIMQVDNTPNTGITGYYLVRLNQGISYRRDGDDILLQAGDTVVVYAKVDGNNLVNQFVLPCPPYCGDDPRQGDIDPNVTTIDTRRISSLKEKIQKELEEAENTSREDRKIQRLKDLIEHVQKELESL